MSAQPVDVLQKLQWAADRTPGGQEAIDAVRDLMVEARAMRDNFRCVLEVNCKCDAEFINAQTASFDAAIARCKGAQP